VAMRRGDTALSAAQI